jgi:hypothetical protein
MEGTLLLYELDGFVRAPRRLRICGINRNSPLPNHALPYNWQQAIALPSTTDVGTAKIDYVISDRDALSGHFYIARGSGLMTGDTPDDCPGCTSSTTSNGYNVSLMETHTFSPSAVLALIASWSRRPGGEIYDQNPSSFDTRSLFKMAIPSSITATDVMNAYPQFSITGFTPFGDLGNVPNFQYDESYELASDLALTKGKHSLKMGSDLNRYRTGRFVNDHTNGWLSYGNTNPAPGSGYALADFLLGYPDSTTISTKPLTVDVRHEVLSFFIADKWRATPKLTFDVGLRYEFDGPPNEHWGRMSSFDFTPPGQFHTFSPGQGLWNPSYRNWAPRVGLTYQLTSKDVIRTAYGTYYSYPSMLFFILLSGNPPFVFSYNFGPNPGAPLFDSNPFPIGQPSAGGVRSPSGSLLRKWFRRGHLTP